MHRCMRMYVYVYVCFVPFDYLASVDEREVVVGEVSVGPLGGSVQNQEGSARLTSEPLTTHPWAPPNDSAVDPPVSSKTIHPTTHSLQMQRVHEPSATPDSRIPGRLNCTSGVQ
jgi:hypothetical protein